MESQIKSLSQVFGLTDYEARVYLAAVYTGPALINQIAKAANLPRTAVYPPVTSLIKRGLMGNTVIGKRKYYVAIKPEKLKTILEERTLALDKIIENIVQKENIRSPQNDLDIVYFIGQHGVLSAGQSFLDETVQKIWYSFENTPSVASLVGSDREDNYIQQRIERGINSKMILSTDIVQSWLEDLIKKDKEQLRETVMISPKEYPFKSTVVVTRGLVLMINPGENPFAVLIRNNHLATTLISIHRLLWERYKK